MTTEKVILTGDRPTGPLHLGHYVGSLSQRVELQDRYTQYILLADLQALTDNFEYPKKIRDNVLQVVLDYLAVGIDPNKSNICLQSMIPEIAELSILFMNLVTVNRLKRNPTVKVEIQQKEFGESLPVGFFVYPIHQAADITIVKANLVPVGADQLPMIEQTNEIVRSFNRIYQTDVLIQAEALLTAVSRLPGIDGKAKMSKSLGNAIFLSDESDVITKKVMNMYTDPGHIHVHDPGKVEGNTVFAYLDIFDPNKETVTNLKQHYRRGGLGDVTLKKYLIDVLESFLHPIRKKRAHFAKDPQYIMEIVYKGTEKAREVGQQTMQEVKKAMYLDYSY